MRKVKVIRDPVHGYLTIAAHESIIIDNPITQRLRRINQTGLAELVFPEARTSRFVHSLGAMHLASQFLISCLENADEKVALDFFKEIEDSIIDDYLVNDKDVDKLLHVSSHAGSGLLAGRVVFRWAELRGIHYRALLAIIESALRLAALFHDLGHLPFSHDFEFALKDFIKQDLRGQKADPLQVLRAGLAPHEKLGHLLTRIVLRTLVETAEPSNVERAAFKLAVKILDHEERYDEVPLPQVGALGWLHSLIDGEIDVDRADYLLRDGRALGLEFADYDLARLTNNLKLAHEPKLGYVTVVREQGLSAVESFYLSRSRSNQILVRHHKAAQIGVALRYATTALFKTGTANEFLDGIRALINADNASDATSDILRAFSSYDDGWWTQKLQLLRTAHDPLLSAALNLILWREPTFFTVWKRKGDLKAGQHKDLNRIAEASEREPSWFERRRKRLLGELQSLVALHRFRPYGIQKEEGKDPDLKASVALIETGRGTLLPAAQMSPLILSLYDTWKQDLHLRAFSMNPGLTPDDVLAVFRADT